MTRATACLVAMVLCGTGCKSEAEKAAELKARLELECNGLRVTAAGGWKKVREELVPRHEELKAKRFGLPNEKNAKAQVLHGIVNRDGCRGLVGVFEQNIAPNQKAAWQQCNAEAEAVNKELREIDALALTLIRDVDKAGGDLGAASEAARLALEPRAVRAQDSATKAEERLRPLSPPSLANAVAASKAAYEVCVKVAP